MPTSLRPRVALLVLLGVFLIPIATSSLNGLTHVLTCQQSTRAPFTLDVPAKGLATISSAETLTRGKAHGLCGGLSLDMAVRGLPDGRVRVELPLTNDTRYTWRGSVKLELGQTSVPVGVGEVHPGVTRSAHVDVRVGTGAHRIGGALLIGP